MAANMHSALEISVGGGWSTLGYKVLPKQAEVQGTNSGSWGAQAHVGYALFFTPNIGLGVGANFSHYGANASLSGVAQWKDGIPILSSASYHADVEHQGDYGIWGLNLQNVPGHGFYREQNFHQDYSVAIKNQVSAFLKLGISYEIGQNIHFFANIYGDYGLTSALFAGQTELGFQNDRAGMEAAHSFMPAYNGIITTNNISAKSHLTQVGLEVGIRFVFPHKVTYPCRCYRY